MTTHYSCAQTTGILIDWSEKSAFRLIEALETFGENAVPVFCYAGMSGSALATALSMAYWKRSKDFGMVYVRKEGEKSHGSEVEHDLKALRRGSDTAPIVLVFVDDLVECGATRRRVTEKTRLTLKRHNLVPCDKFIQCLRYDVTIRLGNGDRISDLTGTYFPLDN